MLAIYNYDTRSHLTHLFNNSPSESHLGGGGTSCRRGLTLSREALKTLKTLETLTTLLIIKKLRHRSDGVAHRLSFSRNRRSLSPAPNKPTGSLCIPASAHHPRRDILNSKMSMFFLVISILFPTFAITLFFVALSYCKSQSPMQS